VYATNFAGVPVADIALLISMSDVQEALWHYRQRVITEADGVFIRKRIAQYPQARRRELFYKLCGAWNWVQPNGALRDMVCGGLMLKLHREG